jgi:hypothetical protein
MSEVISKRQVKSKKRSKGPWRPLGLGVVEVPTV